MRLAYLAQQIQNGLYAGDHDYLQQKLQKSGFITSIALLMIWLEHAKGKIGFDLNFNSL